MSTVGRRIAALSVTLSVVVATGGCSWRGVNSLPLPGTAGRGPGSFSIQVQLPDVTNLTENSRVRVGDVTVGNVTRIQRQDWHALLTIRLNGDVDLPENATAMVGQTSLLGSLHVELAPPAHEASVGRLHNGSLVPLSSAGSYPTTEQTLSAVSLLLNNGGIGRFQDITQAFSAALRGREDRVRSLTGQLDQFVSKVNGQIDDIISATESLNNLTREFAARKPVLDRAFQTIPNAIAVLDDQRHNLTDMLEWLGKFSALTTDAVGRSKENLVKILRELGPVLEALAAPGRALTGALDLLLTFPFPKSSIENVFRGDYQNTTTILDLTLSRIDAGLLTGTRFEGSLTELELQWGRTIGQQPSPYTAGNPLVIPYHFEQER